MGHSTPLVQVGEVFAGKYRVERILGEGAMGMVVAAMHLELHERRAVKFMLPSILDNTEGTERFLREARACAKLKSKHVATVYDVGRLDNGAPYIVMEYLEGDDLKKVLQQRRVLPVQEAVTYLLQACEAVGEAHLAGIVHRDLKPANMYLTAGVGGAPCVKVLDFGIAKLSSPAGGGLEQQDMTATTAVMGSPLYMSPEQIRSSRNVDGRSDVWSLGVILFRMVTGALPFQATSTPDLFAMILKDPPPTPSTLNPSLSPALDAVLLRCLEKDVSRRWQTVGELVAALRPFADPQAAREIDGTTHLWRGSMPSIPDAGAAMQPGMSFPYSSSQSTAHARTAMPSVSSFHVPPAPVSSPGFPQAPASNPLAQTGSNPAISASAHGMATGPHGGPYQVSNAGAYPAMPAGVHPQAMEAGMTAQTGGVWANTRGVAQPQPPASRGLAIGMAVGGIAFLAGVLVLVLVLRGNGASSAAPAASAGTSNAPSVRAEPERPGGQTAPGTTAMVVPVGPAEPSAAATPEASGAADAPALTGSKKASAAQSATSTVRTAAPLSPQPAPGGKAGADEFGMGRK